MCPFALALLTTCGSAAPATTSSPASPAGGVPTHDEIVNKAKAEGALKVLSSADPKSIKALKEGFVKKYPFLSNTEVQETTGTDTTQRFVLELKAGQAKDWDVVHVSDEFGAEMEPFLAKNDLLGLAEKGVLAINPKMISPVARNLMSPGTQVGVVVYNTNLVPADKVPKTWEDLLKPEWKGKKMIADIRPNLIGGLVPAKGETWVKDFAAKMKDQQPAWARGQTGAMTSLSAGEYQLHSAAYLNTVKRSIETGTANLGVAIVEPVPVRHTLATAIQDGVKHPNAGLLWLEYLASAEGQKVFDELEPWRASLFSGQPTRTAQLLAGKQQSLVDWAELPKMADWEKMVLQGYGLPQAEIKG